MFETTNRRLEQFLFVHMIKFDSQHKNEAGLTTWVYNDSPEVQRVVAEFNSMLEHNK